MDQIFEGALSDLLDEGHLVSPITSPTSPHSGFGGDGHRTLEVDNWIVDVPAGAPWFLLNPVRGAHVDQGLGMAMWFLSGSDDLDAVGFHNPNARTYSDDGSRLRAPWGGRMTAAGRRSPLARTVQLLRRDPFSLRAVLPVFSDEDLGVESRDVPCLLSVHFRVRDGTLRTTAMLRSLNPFWVWPYDHTLLLLLHHIAASHVGVPPGTFTYVVSSLQVDEKDIGRCERALAAGVAGQSRPEEPRPAAGDLGWEQLEAVLAFEQDVRQGRAAFDGADGAGLSQYWSDVMRHLAWGRHRRGLAARPSCDPPAWYRDG